MLGWWVADRGECFGLQKTDEIFKIFRCRLDIECLVALE